MNKFLRCYLLALFLYGLTSGLLYASGRCQGDVYYKVDAHFESGEPVSVLMVKYKGETQSFTIPFSAQNSTCKKINDDGVIRVTVPADRPRLELVYYFNAKNKLEYIGNASITTSSGEEQVSGIGEINKGHDISAIDLQRIEGEDAAIISKIINTSYNPIANYKVLELYNDMRYIEIDALSESSGHKICEYTERVFYYCKTTSGKNLNLCYSPFSGDITYNYGKQERELSVNNFLLKNNTFIFENKNTVYSISPVNGEILVTQNGRPLSLISCK